jgi:hypothetical protein
VAALLLWTPPGLGIGGAAARTDALRRDSTLAARQADSVRRATGDSVAAYVFIPPDPLGLERERNQRNELNRRVILAVLALGLAWHTIAWWRHRREPAPATAT